MESLYLPAWYMFQWHEPPPATKYFWIINVRSLAKLINKGTDNILIFEYVITLFLVANFSKSDYRAMWTNCKCPPTACTSPYNQYIMLCYLFYNAMEISRASLCTSTVNTFKFIFRVDYQSCNVNTLHTYTHKIIILISINYISGTSTNLDHAIPFFSLF